MNEKGKLKHRLHLMVFQRGAIHQEDVLVEHVVTRKGRDQSAWRKLCRKYNARMMAGVNYVGWVVDEPYWRKHGMAGRDPR